MDTLHAKQTVSLISGDTECCELFPCCDHPSRCTWAAECPKCGEITHGSDILGPYECTNCGVVFSILVDGWVDKREVEDV